jgi:hypothetical protein
VDGSVLVGIYPSSRIAGIIPFQETAHLSGQEFLGRRAVSCVLQSTFLI